LQPGPAHFVAAAEAIPVLAPRLETVDLDVDAVTELGPRDRASLLRDALEARIARHFPVDGDVGHRHAAAFERPRREARPQDDAVRQRIAGRDAERERIRVEDRLRQDTTRDDRRRDRRRAEYPGKLHQLTTRHPRERSIVDGHDGGLGREL
jgi:hypothetical protein